jgi:hypothetical protein
MNTLRKWAIFISTAMRSAVRFASRTCFKEVSPMMFFIERIEVPDDMNTHMLHWGAPHITPPSATRSRKKIAQAKPTFFVKSYHLPLPHVCIFQKSHTRIHTYCIHKKYVYYSNDIIKSTTLGPLRPLGPTSNFADDAYLNRFSFRIVYVWSFSDCAYLFSGDVYLINFGGCASSWCLINTHFLDSP